MGIPGTMYAMLRWRPEEIEGKGKGGLFYDFAQADAQGNLIFTGEEINRNFAKTPSEWIKNKHNSALIVKLTGRLDKNVFDFKSILTPAPYRSSLK